MKKITGLLIMVLLALPLCARSAKKRHHRVKSMAQVACPPVGTRNFCPNWGTDGTTCHVSVAWLEAHASCVNQPHAPIEVKGGRDSIIFETLAGKPKFKPLKYKQIYCDTFALVPHGRDQAFENKITGNEKYQPAFDNGKALIFTDRNPPCFKISLKKDDSSKVDPHIIVTQ